MTRTYQQTGRHHVSDGQQPALVAPVGTAGHHRPDANLNGSHPHIRRLLDELTHQVPEVRQAVVFGPSGGLIANSSHGPAEQGRQLATLAYGYLSLTRGAGAVFHPGACQYTISRFDHGYLAVAGAADGTFGTALLTSTAASPAEAAATMTRLCTELGHLSPGTADERNRDPAPISRAPDSDQPSLLGEQSHHPNHP